ncbi:OmpA family protein, partial [Thalassospira sp. UBA1131]
VVGDRFVFQSEVLFGSGEAELGEEGKDQLAKLGETLTTIAADIPDDIDWVMRVDGHTDKVPIRNLQFASNWELSAARAISVVKFLIDQGVPPNRLVAAGFGEYQPLDNRDDEIAYRRNRRIEFKITER